MSASDDNDEARTDDEPMTMEHLYHERQRLALCGVHAVNNLLQTSRYSKRDFDDVCMTLSPQKWFNNPHRSMLGIGNYDVNVVMVLLQQEGFSVTWHDQRNEITSETLTVAPPKDGRKSYIVGVLWNVPSTSIWGRIFGGRHWIALFLLSEKNHQDRITNNESSDEKVKRYQNQWVNLDSELQAPQLVGSIEECAQLLNATRKDSHVLLVSRGDGA